MKKRSKENLLFSQGIMTRIIFFLSFIISIDITLGAIHESTNATLYVAW